MLTVAELKKILASLPDDAAVSAYDGEVTAIIVEKDGEEIALIRTDEGEP